MPEHNDTLLDKKRMLEVLTYLSKRLLKRFRTTVRLVIHGGAVMVLHHDLSRKRSTPDVDYIHRAFVSEWAQLGVHDAGDRLTTCIRETASAFNLGDDWMNSHADIALPMAQDMYGNLTDPIYNDAVKPTNMQLNTVFKSSGLVLIGVSWSWAVALKLVRYRKDDPDDIAAILSLGSQMRGCKWTVQLLEGWLLNLCSPMGYTNYPPQEINNTRAKMHDAISRTKTLPWDQFVSTAPKPSKPAPTLVPFSVAQARAAATQGQKPVRPVTVHEGGFEHDRKRQERVLASRARTRSFTAPSSARSIIPTAPMPPMPTLPRPPMPKPTPVPSPAIQQPSHVSWTSHSRRTSVSVPAAAQPASIPLPPSTMSSRATSRQPSIASFPTPPRSASVARPPPQPLSAQFLQSLPPGFVPTGFVPGYWVHKSHRPPPPTLIR